MARVWYGLALEFARAHHEVIVLARSFEGQPTQEVIDEVRFERWGGFKQSTSIFADLTKDFVYAAGLLRRLPRADILVTNSFWLPALAGRVSRRSGRIVISANRFPKKQFVLYGHSACIAAASSAVRTAIVEQTPQATSRTVVIPNPIDTSAFHPSGASPAKHSSASPSGRILYVGRLHPEKGVHLLVAAFRHLVVTCPKVTLRIVGPHREDQGGGGEGYLTELRNASAGLPVEFTGPIFDTAALASEYRSADVFCYPSLAERGEAMGISALEAMACGAVPVVSELDCFRDFVSPHVNGVIFNHRLPEPEIALANALGALVANDSRDQMRRKAIATGADYSYAAIAQKFLTEFDRILRQ